MNDNQTNSEKINKVGSGGLMNPDYIIENLNIKNGMTVADFGCGAGYFTIPIAKIVKNNGKVYAIDVLSSSLESVSSKAKLYGLLNITTIRANVESKKSSKIEDESTDFVILANILFQTNDYDSILNEARRITKNDGKIVIIDWIPSKISMGPKFEHCLSENDIKKLAIKNGLKAIRVIDAGSHHYGIVFSVIR
ncbi:MAG: methyltransferase domain-containing protein [Candidatus Pacebacteria bacterium]|nr:methyltransferase domain-containing protein [Candidatus Paceibacterota bacterium]